MNAREASVSVVRTLRDLGHDALFAGGCVRDLLLDRHPVDYDVATSASPDQVIAAFPRTVPVGKAFGVIIVLTDGHSVEVATFRSDGPYSDGRRPDFIRFTDRQGDVKRRDFTINGLLYDPITDQVIDLVAGRADLQARLIRAIGDPVARFTEDRLRLLRAVRFAATLEFEIEPLTADAVRTLAWSIVEVSPERITEELRRMFLSPHRARAVMLMDSLRLLDPIFPELSAMKGVKQGAIHHPEGDVFNHTLACVAALAPEASFELTLATLLHDVGKPATVEAPEGAFARHASVGEEITREVARRLHLSGAESEHVTWLVRNHMRFRDIRKMRESTLKRLLAEPLFHPLASLIHADIVGSHGDLDVWEFALARKRDFDSAPQPLKPLLSGQDLIEMGLQPGPLFKTLLDRLVDAQLEGQVQTPDQARRFIQHLLHRSDH